MHTHTTSSHGSGFNLNRRGITPQIAEPPDGAISVSEWRPHGEKAQTQESFWEESEIQRHTIAAKLRSAGMAEEALVLDDCHTRETHAICKGCGSHEVWLNRCERFYCPSCAPRLARDKRRAVEWWSGEVAQPKHVVVTVRNQEELTKQLVQSVKAAWGKLRRRKFARGWRGGFYSIECTNEGRGWHVHIHALVDASWIDGGQLAREWAEVTAGLGCIVKVKDARRENYLHELLKYVVKGSQLAAWRAGEVADFVRAFSGVRCFGCFGTLYKQRSAFAAFLASVSEKSQVCDKCGGVDWSYFDEVEWIMRSLQPDHPPTGPPPVQPDYAALTLQLS